jgi:predicted signal transduction protein with EAL and GGDEF domain
MDADQLLRQADQAMYQAKLSGKNRYHLFDAAQDRAVRGRHERLDRIHHGLRQGEFVLHYQPKVNMREGRVVGVEALVRWQHPALGLLTPDAFLPTLEHHRLMVELGDWVIDTALAQIAHWRQAGLALPVSVNLDAMQLDCPDFIDKLRAALARQPLVRPGDLELEVLESSALNDIAWVWALHRYLVDELTCPPPLDQHQCNFGQWLDRTPLSATPLYRRIVSLHQDIHHQAEALLALKQAGQSAEALARFGELEDTRNALLEVLQELARPTGSTARTLPG